MTDDPAHEVRPMTRIIKNQPQLLKFIMSPNWEQLDTRFDDGTEEYVEALVAEVHSYEPMKGDQNESV